MPTTVQNEFIDEMLILRKLCSFVLPSSFLFMNCTTCIGQTYTVLSSLRVDRSEIPSPPSTKLRQAISKLVAFGSAYVDLTPVTGSFLETEQYLRFGIVKPSNDHLSATVVVITTWRSATSVKDKGPKLSSRGGAQRLV